MEVIDQDFGENWTLYNGDCCQVVARLPDDSIDLCVHSPPFSNLYIYSDSEADMGNCASDAEFIQHYEYLIPELYRVTVPGRLCIVHCKDLPCYANRDGAPGLKDFPGQIIAAFERHGWQYHSRITIWKCPVVERERTNNQGLLHKTVLMDRSRVRQGMPDYLVILRKTPAESITSDKPVQNWWYGYDENGNPQMVPDGFQRYVGELDPRETTDHPSPYARKSKNDSLSGKKMSIRIWQRYAEPVWWDIDQTDVINDQLAKSDPDQKHICPLQLGLIRRCVDIWSNPGDVVLSPFAGVGSEGVVSVQERRRFVGVELGKDYFNQAVSQLKAAEESLRRQSLF